MACAEALAVFGLQQMPATEAELGRIYRRRAKLCHPDKATGSEGEFKRLQAALCELAGYFKPKPVPPSTLWSKGKAQLRMKIRGSVGSWTIQGTYLKARTGYMAKIINKDNRFIIVDDQFEGRCFDVKVDAYSGRLKYFNVDGQVEVNDQSDSFVSWTNGNVWFKIPEFDLGHAVSCTCQGCRLYKELRYRS